MSEHKVIVVGSINMDIVLPVERLPQAGETIHGKSVAYYPGGKGLNQAVAAARMNTNTLLVGKVGRDAFGSQLCRFLQDNQIDDKMISHCDQASGTALIHVSDQGDNTIVVIAGSNFEMVEDDLKDIPLDAGDVLLSQFEIPLKVIETVFAKGRQIGTINILNPSPIKDYFPKILSLTDIVIVNETELGYIAQVPVDEDTTMEKIVDLAKKIKKFAKQVVIVTLGKRGAVVVETDTVSYIKAQKVDAVDAVGAGDCFAGVLAACLAKNYSVEKSAKIANIAASISVMRQGAAPSMPDEQEVMLKYKEEK